MSANICLLAALFCAFAPLAPQQEKQKHAGLQHAQNPAMKVLGRKPPPVTEAVETFDTRPGFQTIDSLAQLRAAIKKSNQKVRLKPGSYTADQIDPPIDGHHHIFAVTGSGNHFDLRGVTITTPVSLHAKLSSRPHVSDSWHVFGDDNLFEGAYFRNEVDRPYPDYRVTDNEFEVHGNGNEFKDCLFLTRGSIPYGYSDYYGKGSTNFSRLDKHSCLSLDGARNTKVTGCKFFIQSFGHAIHFHGVDGVHIENCLISGVLRPTRDILLEKVGPAKDHDYHAMFRRKRPIPNDEVIPLSEDGLRTYGGDKNVVVINTTIERMRGCVQLHGSGEITLKNVTVREAGDFGFNVTAGESGKVLMENCRADTTYRPVLNFSRGDVPVGASFELTIAGPPDKRLTAKLGSLGFICGQDCKFLFHADPQRPLAGKNNVLTCGDRKRVLRDCQIRNETKAKVVLSEHTSGCRVTSVGPVEDHGKNNRVTKMKKRQLPR